MKKLWLWLLLFPFVIQAALAFNISVETQLTDPGSGEPIVGTYVINFTLYNSTDDMVFTDEFVQATDAQGRFHRYFDINYLFNDYTYVTWQIGADSETSKTLVSYVPNAINSEFLGGHPPSYFASNASLANFNATYIGWMINGSHLNLTYLTVQNINASNITTNCLNVTGSASVTDLAVEGNFSAGCLYCDGNDTNFRGDGTFAGNVTSQNLEVMERLIVHGNATCVGAATPCHAFGWIECGFGDPDRPQYGCAWAGGLGGSCEGTPTACEDLSTALCNNQDGCAVITPMSVIIGSSGFEGNITINGSLNVTGEINTPTVFATFIGRAWAWVSQLWAEKAYFNEMNTTVANATELTVSGSTTLKGLQVTNINISFDGFVMGSLNVTDNLTAQTAEIKGNLTAKGI